MEHPTKVNDFKSPHINENLQYDLNYSGMLKVIIQFTPCIQPVKSADKKIVDIQCLSPAKKYGKKQVRNITSWICDGKFVKAMSIAKRIFLAFINISFFDGELKMCLSLIWYCL